MYCIPLEGKQICVQSMIFYELSLFTTKEGECEEMDIYITEKGNVRNIEVKKREE
jgi:hypothetical protein